MWMPVEPEVETKDGLLVFIDDPVLHRLRELLRGGSRQPVPEHRYTEVWDKLRAIVGAEDFPSFEFDTPREILVRSVGDSAINLQLTMELISEPDQIPRVCITNVERHS